MITVCFTGHRPSKLGGYDWGTQKNKVIMDKLRETILDVMNNSNDKEFKFITGGALGVDQMAFDIISKGREFSNNQNIALEIAIPFKDQPIKWFSPTDVKRYHEQLDDADIITYVDELEDYQIKEYLTGKYYPAKMQKRNEYMVDNSDIVIAVWDGSKGGTYNCIQYAKKQGKNIVIINPKEIN